MEKTLQMVFRNTSGREVTLSLPNPKDGLTAAVVKPIMQQIVDKQLFTSASGDFAQVVEARLKSDEVTPLA